MSSRTKHTINNTISGFVYKISLIVFPFFTRTLIINYFGIEYLGLNSLFTSLLQMLSLAELGLSSAITYCMYKPIAEGRIDEINALYNLYRKLYKIIGIVILGVGSALSPFLQHLINGTIPIGINIYILYFIFLINTVLSYILFAYKDCLLVAHQQSNVSNNINTISTIFLYTIQCVIIILFKNFYLYSIILPISTLLCNIIRSYVVDKSFPNIHCKGKISKEQKKILKKQIAGLLMYKLTSICRNSWASIIISSFLGLIVLANYQNYYYIMNSVSSFFAILTAAATASIGNSLILESKEKNEDDFYKVSLFYIWAAGICTVLLMFTYQPFMKLWLGSEYMLSFSIVISFCVLFYISKLGDVIFMYRQAAGLWWEDKYRPVVESVINVILGLVMIKYYGLAGIIYSTTITIAFINIPWGSYVLFKYYFKKSNITFIVNCIIHLSILLIACLSTYFIMRYTSILQIDNLILNALTCFVLSNIIFYVLYKKMPRTSQYIGTYTKIIRKRMKI